MSNSSKLALLGGTAYRTESFPAWPVFDQTERDGLLSVLDTGVWGFGGPVEAKFTEEWKEFTGARHALCVANGSVSLEIALKAMGIGPGDEVIVPALTWMATAWAPLQVGATPVFADIRPSDWCIDPDQVRAQITPRTKAIIPVHLYSQMAPMDELQAICKEHDLRLLEDCAHAHGSRWGSKSAGTIGDAGSFSFQMSKAMTAGEGGILTTDDDDLADRFYSLTHCGRPRVADVTPLGFGSNNRITEFQAAILLGQMSRIEEQLATRSRNIAALRPMLAEIPGLDVLEQKPEVNQQGLYCLAIEIDPAAFAGAPRDLLVDALAAEGLLVTAPYETVYEAALWTPARKSWNFADGEDASYRLGLNSSCPISERISRRTGIVLQHRSFLGDLSDMESIAGAFSKVSENCGQLRLKSVVKHARSGVGAALRKLRS